MNTSMLDLTLEPVSKPLTRKRYTPEFKAGALNLIDAVGVSAAHRKLEISVQTLYNWKQNRDKGAAAVKDDSPQIEISKDVVFAAIKMLQKERDRVSAEIRRLEDRRMQINDMLVAKN